MRIIPTVGRVVLFWPDVHYLEKRPEGEQPQAAIVTFVHGEECVNLAAHRHTGESYAQTSVRLQQSDSEPLTDPRDPHATWMPFQLGQARAQIPQPSPEFLTPGDPRN
jgi:hypothetical protein